jgi:hypothetical protein
MNTKNLIEKKGYTHFIEIFRGNYNGSECLYTYVHEVKNLDEMLKETNEKKYLYTVCVFLIKFKTNNQYL